MHATIEIDPEEAEFLKASTAQPDIDQALRHATSEYIRFRKRMNLIELNDPIVIDEAKVAEMDRAGEAETKRTMGELGRGEIDETLDFD